MKAGNGANDYSHAQKFKTTCLKFAYLQQVRKILICFIICCLSNFILEEQLI